MKKIISAILIIGILFAFASCGKKEKVEEITSAADLAQYGITINLPEGATDEKYALVKSSNKGEELNIGQATYNCNGVGCTFRTANITNYNVSGYDESKSSNEQSYDLNIGTFTSQIRIMQVDGTYVALWSLGDHSYSLTAKTDDAITFTALAKDTAEANIPTP